MRWRLGVVGFPIAHSLSPQLHAAGLALAGLDGTSERIELRENEASQLRSLMGGQFDALSVTMPLKMAAVQLCDALDDVALRTGVVNSLLTRDGRVHGASTDGLGFVNAVETELSVSLVDVRVVVLGAGGAAHAIVDALVHAGVGSVTVLGRSLANVDSLTSRYDNVHDHFEGHEHLDLIVNTTPAISRDPSTSVLDGVTATSIAIDIAYDPTMTPWRSLYEDAGCRTRNGLGMLAYQAALQMTWWWDVSIDGAELLKVLQ
jgi:shikimate dehydrogenase